MPEQVEFTTHDLERLADLMADNPEFAKKLVDAISARLDEKFSYQQGWMSDKLEEVSEKLDQSIDENRRRFDTIDHNIRDLLERHELHGREFRKVNKRLDRIDGRLGIDTTQKRHLDVLPGGRS